MTKKEMMQLAEKAGFYTLRRSNEDDTPIPVDSECVSLEKEVEALINLALAYNTNRIITTIQKM
jgi:hypothetical protein